MKLALAVLAIIAVAADQSVVPSQDDIVFVCNREGADNACIINSSGDPIHLITSVKGDGEGISSPRWAPGRRKIAFDLRNAITRRRDVHLMNADGTNMQKVTNSSGTTFYRNPA